MTGMVLLAGALIAAAVIIRIARAPELGVKRWVDSGFGWSVASHRDGRYIHLLPEGDGQVHTESHDGDCNCGPLVNRFERTAGGDGWLIIHHSTPAEARR